MLTVTVHETVTEFRRRILNVLGNRICAIVVYGSVARGTARKDSDIDILIIGENKKDWDMISRIAHDIDLENEFRTFITTMFMTKNEFECGLSMADPFIYNVLRDGVVLHDCGFYERVRKN